MPDKLERDVLYISLQFGIITHLCPCGCGEEIVTKLSPTDWRMLYDGETVSLQPSIGNWGLPCRSHYFITRSQVEWAPSWSKSRIDAGRRADSWLKRWHAKREVDKGGDGAVRPPSPAPPSDDAKSADQA